MSQVFAKNSAVGFLTTRWSLVMQVGDDAQTADKRAHALDTLCQSYWLPIYAYLRRTGISSADAEDITQELFMSIVRRESIANIENNQMKFRSFLLGAAKNQVIDHRRKRTSEKRGGQHCIVSLDIEDGEAMLKSTDDSESPEVSYDRTWARALIQAATKELESSYEKSGKTDLFHTLQPYLFGAADLPGHDELSEKLGMGKGAIAMSVKRMREKFGQLLTNQVADTVTDQSQIDEELRYLLSLFAS